MIAIPFVFNGTEDEFRALNPTALWGRWTATFVGPALVGVIHAANPNVRAHTHEKMTMLPSSGHRKLSDEHIAALGVTKANIGKGDTLADALEKLHAIHGADFLHPDRIG